MAILFDLPSDEDLQNWRNIKKLVALLGLKDANYNDAAEKYTTKV